MGKSEGRWGKVRGGRETGRKNIKPYFVKQSENLICSLSQCMVVLLTMQYINTQWINVQAWLLAFQTIYV